MFAVANFASARRILLLLLCGFLGTQTLSAIAELKFENELLLELRLDGESLGLDILGYQREQEFLLSLSELTSAIRFPVVVDAEQGTASGWYISEDRLFALDLERSLVTSGNNQWQISEGEVVKFEGDIFVELNTLQKWFPLQLSAVIRQLYLDVIPDEPLPIQLRDERRDRVITRSNGSQEPQYPLQSNPYKFFSPHVTKFSGGYSTTRQNADSDTQYSLNYATLSRGDLGWMTSTISLAGQSTDSLTAAFLKLERSAFDGPLGLNHVEFGDVDAGGAGVLFRGGGNKTQGDRFDTESVSIEGSQLPDWDIELYQNGQLVAIQTTGPEGRYLFADVPLQFGENQFELKFFGPNGEVESREEFHFLGVGMLDAGSVSYEGSAVQSGRTVLGVNDADVYGEEYAGAFNVGLSRNLTVGAGVKRQDDNGEQLTSSNLNVGLSTSRFFSSINYNSFANSQDALSMSLRTAFGSTSINLGYTRFFDDVELVDSVQQWQSTVDITSSIFALPVKFELNTAELSDSTNYGVAIGTTIPLPGRGRLSSSLFYSSFENRSDGFSTRISQTSGQSSFYTSLRPWSFRLSASYGLDPEIELLALVADSHLSIDSDLSLDLSVSQNPSTDTVAYFGGVNWRMQKVALNASVGYDSNEFWSGRVSLTTTLLHQSGTLRPRFDSRASVNSGTVEVRVFEDADTGERVPVAEVGVDAVQAWRGATTDDAGIALISGMPAYRQVDVELDDATIPDYDLQSKNPGVSIVARPGSYAIVEFPLVHTAELEGNIYIDDDDKTPVNRALVTLKSPEGNIVTQTRTAYDGFFLFQGIEPGAYQLALEEPLTLRIQTRPGEVIVLGDSGVITALDFTVTPVQTEKRILRTQKQETLQQQQSESIRSTAIAPSIARALPDLTGEPEPRSQPEPESQPKPQTSNGTWFVQIGAYNSRDKAQATWDRLSGDMQTLQGKTARFMPFQSMTRLLVGPGRTKDAASTLCRQLKTDNLDCLVRQIE